MHLTPEQLVDLAEGTADGRGDAHLSTCEACRRQLAELRAMMAAAEAVEAPEPSPLFWDQLSARVRDAVAVEPAPNGWNWWLRAATPFALATAAAVFIAFVITTRLLAPESPTPSRLAFVPQPPVETLAPDVTDPSLALVAELSQDFEWDATREAGLAPRGSADHAVAHLSDAELRQLRDLLREEMGKSSD